VLDSGCTKTTATPVHDGYALQKSILRCSIGGETITDRFESWIRANNKDLEIRPRFTFKRKFKNIDG
jgi:actin-related protein